MEHQELNIEDTRFTRETPDYKFVPSPFIQPSAISIQPFDGARD